MGSQQAAGPDASAGRDAEASGDIDSSIDPEEERVGAAQATLSSSAPGVSEECPAGSK
jgi:hypothetical protein